MLMETATVNSTKSLNAPDNTELRPTVLFVDDELNMLRALKRRYRKESFHSVFAGSCEEALGILAQTPVAVVVADMRMPGRDGIELLGEVKSRYPATTRMMLSACTATSELVATINSGVVSAYFPKPLGETKELRDAILSGIADFYENLLKLASAPSDDAGTQYLPVCSYCNKIRDEKQKWRDMVEYLWTELNLKFSHGVCPCCWGEHVKPQLDEIQKCNCTSHEV
jgi:response regulator RpfG family c-di-GMP phosphodiesterase